VVTSVGVTLLAYTVLSFGHRALYLYSLLPLVPVYAVAIAQAVGERVIPSSVRVMVAVAFVASLVAYFPFRRIG
jgi:uncharacterized membrane protein (GlpM family)